VGPITGHNGKYQTRKPSTGQSSDGPIRTAMEKQHITEHPHTQKTNSHMSQQHQM